jgi:hypothetical protein
MYCVYHIEGSEEGLIPVATFYTQLTEALNWSEDLRKQGFQFVTMVSENPDVVGKPGVDAVENGVCPDGVEYSWVKRR